MNDDNVRERMGMNRPDRKEAEQAYVENHDIAADPIGSTKWCDYWQGWQQAREALPFTLGELAVLVNNPATLLALAAQQEKWAEEAGGIDSPAAEPYRQRRDRLLAVAHEVDSAGRKAPEHPANADPNRAVGAFRVMPYPPNDKVMPGRALIMDASGGYLGTSNGFPHMGSPALFPEEQAVAIVCAINFVFQGIGQKRARELMNDPEALPLAFWAAFPTTH